MDQGHLQMQPAHNQVGLKEGPDLNTRARCAYSILIYPVITNVYILSISLLLIIEQTRDVAFEQTTPIMSNKNTANKKNLLSTE